MPSKIIITATPGELGRILGALEKTAEYSSPDLRLTVETEILDKKENYELLMTDPGIHGWDFSEPDYNPLRLRSKYDLKQAAGYVKSAVNNIVNLSHFLEVAIEFAENSPLEQFSGDLVVYQILRAYEGLGHSRFKSGSETTQTALLVNIGIATDLTLEIIEDFIVRLDKVWPEILNYDTPESLIQKMYL